MRPPRSSPKSLASRQRRRQKQDRERNAKLIFRPVILSGAGSVQCALPAKSKAPVPARALMPRKEFCPWSALCVLILASAASAQTLTGKLTNSTTGKPAAGDEVILLSLGQGMEESGRTRSDAKGNFSFKLDDAQGPHLVRAIHEGVTYHAMAPPGKTSVELAVYDVGKKIEGIVVVADVMRIQVEQGQMEIMRQFAVQNTSQPPRTQMNERNLEFYVPEGSQIVAASAMTEGGSPINSAPVPVDDKKTRYAFLFPLRPGITQFEVAYQLAYTGSANIDPKSVYPLQHFVAMLPKSMQFLPAPGANYKVTPYPNEPDANVEVISGTAVGQSLAFKISGEGTLQSSRNESAGGGAGEGGSTGSGPQAESRPGGGLGPPIDAPNPLQKYQLQILGGLALALGRSGVFVASRQQAATRAGRHIGNAARMTEGSIEGSAEGSTEEEEFEPVVAAARSSSSMLLEGQIGRAHV